MADLLLFGRPADARRSRPRRFRLFNAHLDEYLGENDVKSRFRLGRDSINFLADLLSDDLARNTLPSPWALTNRPKIRGEFPEISNFSSGEDDNCSLRIFQ